MSEMSDKIKEVNQPTEKKGGVSQIVRQIVLGLIILCLIGAWLNECSQHADTERLAQELALSDSIKSIAEGMRLRQDAEAARLEAEQEERNLHIRIAARARAFTLLTNSVKAPDSVRIQARLEMAAWLDSLRTGGNKPEAEESENEKSTEQDDKK